MAETLRAEITAPDGFRCAPEGHTTITIPCGEVVTGHVAKWALDDGAAKRMGKPKRKPGAAAKKR